MSCQLKEFVDYFEKSTNKKSKIVCTDKQCAIYQDNLNKFLPIPIKTSLCNYKSMDKYIKQNNSEILSNPFYKFDQIKSEIKVIFVKYTKL
jgi:hypothetical protein